MFAFKKLLFASAVALAALAFDAGTASAQYHTGGSIHGPFGNQPHYPTLSSFVLRNHNKPTMPTFQAAPWYMYWPYDAHFMTPAPIISPFNAPPITGNFPVNPYFPRPAAPQPSMPGGPPPYGIPAPAGIPVPRQ